MAEFDADGAVALGSESTFGTHRPNVPKLALDVSEACEALGVSWDFWQAHVAPEVRIVRRGRRKLVPVAELMRWLDENAELALNTGVDTLTSPKSPANRGVRARRAPGREAA